MSDWKPQPNRSIDVRTLALSAEEGFLLSRLDGATPVSRLTALTGLPPERVQAALQRLVASGAVVSSGAAAPTPPPVRPLVAPGGPGARAPQPVAARPAQVAPRPAHAASGGPGASHAASGGPELSQPMHGALGLSRPVHGGPEASQAAHGVPGVADAAAPASPGRAPAAGAPGSPATPGEGPPTDEAPLALEAADTGATDDGAAADADAEDTADAATVDAAPDDPAVEATHRALFERTLHAQPEDVRVALAQRTGEPELSALCFDPVPAVVRALLDNPHAGPVHARLVARHHRNAAGLEALAARASLLADAGVRRWLLRNPQLSVALLRRMLTARRLLEQHKVVHDRDVPEHTRRAARDLLRQRFASGAASEEKVELILRTEGRALAGLIGLPLDGKSTALLCSQTFRSTTLVQNVARWAAAPPALIAHLLRQESVRRSPTLRQLVARHPNAPPEARRS